MEHTYRKHIKNNPSILFVFGDNDQRKGFGGMAKEFRGEENSIGIRTKKYPSMQEDSFYTDKEFEENKAKIDEDISLIKEKFKSYIAIIIPKGIGSGYAKLEQKAPTTYKYLKDQLHNLKKGIEK
jgi:hypothetical protein